jgi:hypothetical protein
MSGYYTGRRPRFFAILRIRIGSGFSGGLGSGFAIRIRIQKDKKDPQRWKKVNKFHLFQCWMFYFEGLIAIFDQNNVSFFFCCFYFFFNLWSSKP